MSSSPIIRQIYLIGRITFPIEMRRLLNINTNDSLAVFCDEKKIIIKKYQPDCVFCGNLDEEELYPCKGKMVCKNCIIELKEQYKE